jgi:hypothetical protein
VNFFPHELTGHENYESFFLQFELKGENHFLKGAPFYLFFLYLESAFPNQAFLLGAPSQEEATFL